MLKESSLHEAALKERLRQKFESLRQKLAIEMDIPLRPVPQKSEGSLQNQNPENIKMNIDFTKLAKIAHQSNRVEIS